MIYLQHPTNDYTVLPNDLLQGSVGLDAESLGVLVYLLSHPSDWRVFGTQIAKHFGMSTDRVTRITKRLESSGYLVRKDVRDAHGWDWDVYDTPSAKPDPPPQKPEVYPQKPERGCRNSRMYKVIRNKVIVTAQNQRHGRSSNSKRRWLNVLREC